MKRLLVIITLLMVSTLLAGEGPASKVLTVKDLMLEDQHKVQLLNLQIESVLKDMELAQARLDRLNEVQIPGLVESIRATYQLPKEEWDFDLKSFTFTKKERK